MFPKIKSIIRERNTIFFRNSMYTCNVSNCPYVYILFIKGSILPVLQIEVVTQVIILYVFYSV